MKKIILWVLIGVLLLSLIGCSKEYSREAIKNDIKQAVKDVYSPKTMKQFRDSYEKVTNSGLITPTAADSFYVASGTELTEEDLNRSSYVDVMYSNKKDNSEGKSHYLAKLQLHGADGKLTTADIFFYVDEDANEEKQTTINKILVSNLKTE